MSNINDFFFFFGVQIRYIILKGIRTMMDLRGAGVGLNSKPINLYTYFTNLIYFFLWIILYYHWNPSFNSLLNFVSWLKFLDQSRIEEIWNKIAREVSLMRVKLRPLGPKIRVVPLNWAFLFFFRRKKCGRWLYLIYFIKVRWLTSLFS